MLTAVNDLLHTAKTKSSQMSAVKRVRASKNVVRDMLQISEIVGEFHYVPYRVQVVRATRKPD